MNKYLEKIATYEPTGHNYVAHNDYTGYEPTKSQIKAHSSPISSAVTAAANFGAAGSLLGAAHHMSKGHGVLDSFSKSKKLAGGAALGGAALGLVADHFGAKGRASATNRVLRTGTYNDVDISRLTDPGSLVPGMLAGTAAAVMAHKHGARPFLPFLAGTVAGDVGTALYEHNIGKHRAKALVDARSQLLKD